MEEKILLDDGLVLVSNSRFIVSNQTYAISNITSVRDTVEKASKTPSILMFLLGLFLLFGLETDFVQLVGVIFTIGGIYVFIKEKDKHHLILTTSSGESRALMSHNKSYINSVVLALNDAIISRG